MTFIHATLRPANAAGAFILNNDGDEQLLFAEDLARLRDLIDQALPRLAHNHESNDPDDHVVFRSVCCGASLYRCAEASDGLFGRLPSKPIISQGEDACATCGANLS